MGLLTIFKRRNDAAPAASAAPTETAAEVARARARARRRLIGAVVLVAIGIVGFPLVFETQPRPIPVDIPIEIPRKDGAPPLAMPPARVALNGASGANAVPEPDSPPAADVITEKGDDAGRDATPPADAPPAAKPAPQKPAETERPVERPADRTAETAPEKTADKPLQKPAPDAAAAEKSAEKAKPADKPPRAADDGARAAALLAGKDAPKADTSKADANARYIVQVGAFTESSAAQETRAKIERLGMKTYTQVASTPGGNRIRVRMGPFATRDDADKALAKAKAAGMTGVVLTL